MSAEVSTHWETCWQAHLDCALVRLVQLDHENRDLRVALAAIICRGREALGYDGSRDG